MTDMFDFVSFNKTLEDALHSDKTVRYVVGSNGFFELTNSANYEVLTKRKQIVGPETPFDQYKVTFDGSEYILSKNGFWISTGVNEVFEKVNTIPNTEKVEPYFNFKLPRIPKSLLYEVVTFFASIYSKYQTEILAHIYFDTKTQTYLVNVPRQEISATRVFFEKEQLPPNMVKVCEFHSHHVLPAKFSNVDDADETEIGIIYGVVGNFKNKKANPGSFDIALRVRDREDFTGLKLKDIFTEEATAINSFDLQARIHLWNKNLFVHTKKSNKKKHG
jgi:PRTRC genetic system protein A